MIGMDRRTGRPLAGVAHLRQSIEDILGTRRGSRRMRPEYGSDLYLYVDLPVTGGWKSSVAAEVIRALRRWEPRIRIERVMVLAVKQGKIHLRITGEYLGDSAVLEVAA
jgi:phage baseplate assembly protein W